MGEKRHDTNESLHSPHQQLPKSISQLLRHCTNTMLLSSIIHKCIDCVGVGFAKILISW